MYAILSEFNLGVGTSWCARCHGVQDTVAEVVRLCLHGSIGAAVLARLCLCGELSFWLLLSITESIEYSSREVNALRVP